MKMFFVALVEHSRHQLKIHIHYYIMFRLFVLIYNHFYLNTITRS